MELVCLENMTGRKQRATLDPAIYKDPRVLSNLLSLEPAYSLSTPYFGTVQPQLKSYMRKIITSWMLEICENQCCEEQVFPLAVNLMDRFLSSCEIPASHLQLTATTTLLLASKLRMSVPLSLNLLSYYTHKTITPEQIKEWEMLVLSKLCWEVCAVTGFDFLDHILNNLQFSAPSQYLRAHALTLLALAYTETDLMCIKGSVLSCASVVGAARGLKMLPDILGDACLLVKADPDLVNSIVSRIEIILEQEALRLYM